MLFTLGRKMKWHLRGFSLFSDFQKAFLMSYKQKCCLWRLCRGRKTSKRTKCQSIIERYVWNIWPFMFLSSSMLLNCSYYMQNVYTVFSHYLEAKSHITCNEISSPNSLSLNLNPTKHSFWRTSSLFHFPRQVNNTISFDYKPCTHAL